MTPIVALLHDWFDWSVLIVGTIAAATGVLGVILAGVLLFRSRPECDLGPLVTSGTGTRGRLKVSIKLHVVASGHWVRKPPRVTFTIAGKPIEALVRGLGPASGVGEYEGYLSYEMDQPAGPIDVQAVYRFRHGGKTAKFHGTFQPPRV